MFSFVYVLGFVPKNSLSEEREFLDLCQKKNSASYKLVNLKLYLVSCYSFKLGFVPLKSKSK